jgi:hypothetical protein
MRSQRRGYGPGVDWRNFFKRLGERGGIGRIAGLTRVSGDVPARARPGISNRWCARSLRPCCRPRSANVPWTSPSRIVRVLWIVCVRNDGRSLRLQVAPQRSRRVPPNDARKPIDRACRRVRSSTALVQEASASAPPAATTAPRLDPCSGATPSPPDGWC